MLFLKSESYMHKQLKMLPTIAPRKLLAAILLMATLLRVLSIYVLHSYIGPDSWEFGTIAHNMLAGHGFSMYYDIPSAHMPPLYCYLLWGLWKYFGESPTTYLALELFQALLGVLLVLVVYRLSLLLASRRVALIAATMVAVWPSFVYLCDQVHSISIYILLGVAAVYFTVHYVQVSHSWRDAICIGLCMGGLLLCRAEAVVLLCAYAFILIVRCGRGSTSKALVTCLIALACLAPWTIRNCRVLGYPILVSSAGGFNLWVGHNPHASGNSDYSLDDLNPSQRARWEGQSRGREYEINDDRLFTSFAINYMRSQPKAEIILSARKFFFFVFFDPTHDKSRRVLYYGPSLLLTFLAFYGMWLKRSELLVSYLPVTFTIVFAVLLAVAVFALPRYRIAIDPFLTLFAAQAIARGVEKVGGLRQPGLLPV